MNVPLVTTQLLTVPVDVLQVPEPEKEPTALVLDRVETVIDPAVSEHALLNEVPPPACAVRNTTSLQVLVPVATQFTSMLNVPVDCPLTVMAVRSDVVLVLGTFAATFVLLSLASLKPAAHVVVNGLLASAADVMPPVALNDPPPPPV